MPKRKAFKLRSLVDAPGRVRCLTYSSTEVYVGTEQGKVLAYDRFGRTGMAPLKEETLSKGKKKVDQIICVEDTGRLVVLCGGVVTIHDLRDLRRISSLTKAKGAALMAMDQTGPPFYRLCVAAKRSMRGAVLHLYECVNKEHAEPLDLHRIVRSGFVLVRHWRHAFPSLIVIPASPFVSFYSLLFFIRFFPSSPVPPPPRSSDTRTESMSPSRS